MPSKKSSVFIRKAKAPRRPKYSQKPRLDKSTKPKKSGDMIKQGINETSALGLHIQKLLDTTFAPAPPVLREYLKRADNEIRDLIKLLTTKLGGTPDHDAITVTASALLEDLIDVDPKTSAALAAILADHESTVRDASELAEDTEYFRTQALEYLESEDSSNCPSVVKQWNKFKKTNDSVYAFYLGNELFQSMLHDYLADQD